ncbi:phage tail protein [Tunturiibacter lichenicola]|uniref:phage tail protein n=1 Tax=Tunturiibacter lichenicola TaxID=2051959 RepID=UPI0021B187A3|nr:phage tail protein [Edaphobacter lichenicola]
MPVTGPFENRRFLVVADNAAIPGISNVSSLQWTADLITLTEGGSPVSISEPGKIKYQPLTIEREVSFDPFFEDWAQLVARHGSQQGSIFKDLIIKIFDPAEQLVVSYNVYRCWPITFEAFSTLDVDGHVMLQERLVLIYQSFERDLLVVAPA